MKQINEAEALELINFKGETAYGLLSDADQKLITRFERIDTSLIKLLADVKKHFPDAVYYTGSGGFNLLIGGSHGGGLVTSQQELIACSGQASIGDGDF